MINSYETLVIPKKIKTASGVMAKVVGVEAGAFKDNTQIKTLKVSADCALSVVTSAGDGSTKYTSASQSNGGTFVWTSESSTYVSSSYNASSRNVIEVYNEGFQSTIGEGTTTYEWRDTVYPTTNKTNALGAFEGCVNLSKIYLTGNIEMIGRNTFKNCTNIGMVEIPNSCQYIGAGAFIGCPSLNIITKSNTIKFPTKYHGLTTHHGSNIESEPKYCSIYKAGYDLTTNLFNSALTGIVFDSGVSKKCTA